MLLNHSARKIVFFHIMKTGGTTFQSILSSIFGDRFHVCDDPSIASIEASLAKYDCLEFHMLAQGNDWIFLHSELMRQRRWDLLAGRGVFTMLRDPVDQFLSQYFYAVQIRKEFEAVLRASGVSFPETLEECMEDPGAFNNQLAFLVGKSQLSETRVNRDDLATAKEMLLDLRAHIGLTERFSDSMNIFETVTGLTIPKSDIANQKQNPDRPKLDEVSTAIKDTIRERSALDVELYEFGRELFEEDFTRCTVARDYSFVSRTVERDLTQEARAAAQRAVAYLSTSQLPDGEFQRTWVTGMTQAEDGRMVEQHASCSCPFMTALILYSLQFAKDLDPTGEQTMQRGLKFLVSDMDPGGLWRFPAKNSPKRVRVPPDLDDTACAAQVLRANGISFPNNHGLFYDTRDERGLFFTWLMKPNSWRKWILHLRTRGNAFSNAEDLWSPTADSVCAVVNANVVLYLGETSGTRTAIDYLLRIIRDGTEDKEMVFYAHRFSLYYMTSRAYFAGVTALEEAKPIMKERIRALQQPDGSFGDELLTALGVCSLMNLDAQVEGIDKSIEYLMSMQRADGSWQRVAMYGGPPVPNVLGSIDLTTGYCMEALARYAAMNESQRGGD